MPDLTHHKWSHHLDGNFHVYLRAKNQLNPTTKSSSMSTFVNFTQNPFLSKKKNKNGHTQGHGWFGEPDDRILIEA